MNPRLIKFAVELQNGEKAQKTQKTISFEDGGVKRFFGFNRIAKVTVPVTNDD